MDEGGDVGDGVVRRGGEEGGYEGSDLVCCLGFLFGVLEEVVWVGYREVVFGKFLFGL